MLSQTDAQKYPARHAQYAKRNRLLAANLIVGTMSWNFHPANRTIDMQLSIILELFSVMVSVSRLVARFFLCQLTDRCTQISVVHQRGCSRHVERPVARVSIMRCYASKRERTIVGIVDDEYIDRE